MKAQRIVLEVHICSQRRSYKTVFTGTDAEIDANAASFWEARKTYCAMWDWSENQPTVDPDRHPITFDLLYPTCEHGLSGLLCSGPNHYAEPGTPGWD